MTLLAVERVKLFTTRSPWWCILLSLVVTIGFAGLISATAPDQIPVSVGLSQAGYEFGLLVIMVMAALAVTTEYRTGTIKATFQAIPNRSATLVAKAVVVAILAGIVGEACAFGSWGLAKLLRPDAPLSLASGAALRNVAGVGLIYLIAAIVAVAVGILLRHTAGAVATLLIYVMLVESLVQLIPTVGNDIHQWMPFNVGARFLTAGEPHVSGGPMQISDSTLSPWLALAYFGGFAIVLMIIALISAVKRDA